MFVQEWINPNQDVTIPSSSSVQWFSIYTSLTARKSNQSILKEISWEFIGRTDAEVEAPILWPPGAKSQLIGKDPDAGKDWGQEEKGATENEMVGMAWPTQCTWVEQTLGHSEGQGSLVCCIPWGCKVRHDWVTTQRPPPYIGELLRTKSLSTFLIRNFYVYHGAASSITCQKWE